MFRSLLIANRGEIAVRIIRTAKRLGIRTVAVYSDADADALHVALADSSVRLGPAPARESYLSIQRVLDAARSGGAEAVHPGYGFLSENDAFAEACAKAGLVFIGPPPEAIRAMGDKSASKALMQKTGVPLVPGYHGGNQDPALLAREAQAIGFPVLIKAAAGGGGKGMRIVRGATEFDDMLAACKREAMNAFGDDRVLIERFLDRPRHIEIQVFADRHGNCISLGERDCSSQRRHQKVIEEAPAPGMNTEQRQCMGAAAVAAARAVGYVGAGTVEFIVDAKGAFHFMEMNTRLQVEHPVTEMVTGLDLVELQLRVASGEPLPIGQSQVRLEGHSIEARLYAEDTARGFLPSTGRLAHLVFPDANASVRVDTGVRVGDTITSWYDPMIAKIIVHGEDRAAAVRRLVLALEHLEAVGPATNRDFLLALARHAAFGQGTIDTGFIERELGGEHIASPTPQALALAAFAELQQQRRFAREKQSRTADAHSPWAATDGWRLNQDSHQVLVYASGKSSHALTVHYCADGMHLEVDGHRHRLHGEPQNGPQYSLTFDCERVAGRIIAAGSRRHVFIGGVHHVLDLHDALLQEIEVEVHGGGVTAPMPGKVIAVLAKADTRVEKGTPLVILEAMKMEHTLLAPARGRVHAIRFAVGDQVAEGEALIEFETEKEP